MYISRMGCVYCGYQLIGINRRPEVTLSCNSGNSGSANNCNIMDFYQIYIYIYLYICIYIPFVWVGSCFITCSPDNILDTLAQIMLHARLNKVTSASILFCQLPMTAMFMIITRLSNYNKELTFLLTSKMNIST